MAFTGRFARLAEKAAKGFSFFEEIFLCFLLFSMILLACVQIVLRDVFSGGFLWADPLLRYMVMWAGLLGAAVATKTGKHIAIDVITHLVPARVVSWLQVVINFFSAAVCSVLTYAAVQFVRNEASFGGGREVLGIPSWGMNLVFPIVFAVISLRFMIRAALTAKENIRLLR